MDRAAEERAGDFPAHQVSGDVICTGFDGEPSKAEQMLSRLLLYAHLRKSSGINPILPISFAAKNRLHVKSDNV